MKKSLAAASLLVLLVVITGCQHRRKLVTPPPPPPQRAEGPPATPHASTVAVELPEFSAPSAPNVVLGGAVAPAPLKRELPAHQDETAQDTQSDQVDASKSATAGEEPPTTTPIGQLSAAPNTHGLPSKANIAQEIGSIQKQLDNIHHALSASEQKTASQIRTFLGKATNALQAGDLDGAHTLTVKARVLLSELQ